MCGKKSKVEPQKRSRAEFEASDPVVSLETWASKKATPEENFYKLLQRTRWREVPPWAVKELTALANQFKPGSKMK